MMPLPAMTFFKRLLLIRLIHFLSTSANRADAIKVLSHVPQWKDYLTFGHRVLRWYKQCEFDAHKGCEPLERAICADTLL